MLGVLNMFKLLFTSSTSSTKAISPFRVVYASNSNTNLEIFQIIIKTFTFIIRIQFQQFNAMIRKLLQLFTTKEVAKSRISGTSQLFLIHRLFLQLGLVVLLLTHHYGRVKQYGHFQAGCDFYLTWLYLHKEFNENIVGLDTIRCLMTVSQ